MLNYVQGLAIYIAIASIFIGADGLVVMSWVVLSVRADMGSFPYSKNFYELPGFYIMNMVI